MKQTSQQRKSPMPQRKTGLKPSPLARRTELKPGTTVKQAEDLAKTFLATGAVAANVTGK